MLGSLIFMDDVVMTKQIYLAVHQADATAPPLAVLHAAAGIPLCWLSLFELTDFHAVATLQLSCALPLAQQRWLRRLPALLHWLGPASAPLLDGFSRWLARQSGQQLQLQLNDFAAESSCLASLQQYFADLQQIEQASLVVLARQSDWCFPLDPALWRDRMTDANLSCHQSSLQPVPTASMQLEVRELFHPHTLEITVAVVLLAPESPDTLLCRLQHQLHLYPNLTPFLYLGSTSEPLGQALQQRLLTGQLDAQLAGMLLLALDHSLLSAQHYQALQFTPAVGVPMLAALTADGGCAGQFDCGTWSVEQLDLMLAALRQWLQLWLPE
jgi:hypothetical protein